MLSLKKSIGIALGNDRLLTTPGGTRPTGGEGYICETKTIAASQKLAKAENALI
jgi:hypothetical protein